MIEVEKKFGLNESEKARLIDGAEFLGEHKITDVYYDTPDYSLTTTNRWLRCRNGAFELKVAAYATPGHWSERPATQYREIQGIEILKALELAPVVSIEKTLEVHGYRPFATLRNTRQKYRKEGFAIDVDSVDFGYNLVEIELIAERETDVEASVVKIMEFAARHRLPQAPTRGKLLEYLLRNNPKHYQILVERGVA